MAVVRLKRRWDENPVDSLLFASKRLKTEEGGSEIDPTLFKFAATVASKEQDCSASACVNKVLRSEHLNSETTPKTGKDRNTITAKNRKISDITEKLRRENQLHSQKSRYEVVNLFRNIKPEDFKEDGDVTPLTVIDIVNQEKSSDEIKESEYVYDLYYTQMGSDLDELIAGNTYSILPIQDELYLGGDTDENSDLEPEDDEDSNEENNYRNDYPDEDEVKDDEDEYKSEEDYEGDIMEYGEDPDVSGIANDFIGQCRLADSEDDMYSDADLSSDDDEDKIYDEDLVLSHSSYSTYLKKKAKREAYRNDIDDEDEYS
ncbi:hypothetical protein M8J76_011211 [Diaphorina citri]|nr:hypothetical protein M8J76_011211 [Diaphorina citri]KAI5743049.1 hypothetical protein M8J77_013913 [Diaphorina citri]